MDYIVYDKNRIISVRCMNCKTEVQTLATGTLYTREGKPVEVSQVFPLNNLSKGKPISIVNQVSGQKSFIEPILCKDCVGKELDVNEIIEQVKLGWRLGLEAQRKPKEEVEKYMNTHGNIKAGE